MADNDLPEDFKKWPRDPYRLLGVEAGCGALAVRKAYTRLIRRFKPEQFPEPFRLIREAFESATRFEEFSKRPGFPAPSIPDELPAFSPSEDMGGATISSQPRRTAPVEDLDQLWEKACDGEAAAVYQRLTELIDRPALEADVIPRLYWLLRAFPELDVKRAPIDWLVRGMRRNDVGPWRELYRREVEANPREIDSDRFTIVLRATRAPFLLAELLEWRWAAFYAGGAAVKIGPDLEKYQPRFEEADDIWVRLLLRAAEYLAWSPATAARGAYERTCRAIERAGASNPRLDGELTRLDFLKELTSAWHNLRNRSRRYHDLLDWVEISWTRPFSPDQLPPLRNWLSKMVDAPADWVAQFDGLSKASPLLSGQLLRYLLDCQFFLFHSFIAAKPTADAVISLSAVIPNRRDAHFSDVRAAVLQICRNHCLPLGPLLQTTQEQSPNLAQNGFFQYLFADISLQIVCLANYLFWT